MSDTAKIAGLKASLRGRSSSRRTQATRKPAPLQRHGLYPKGMQWYWRGDFVKTLPDAAIDAHLEQAAKTPSELSLIRLYPIDGAVHDPANLFRVNRNIKPAA